MAWKSIHFDQKLIESWIFFFIPTGLSLLTNSINLVDENDGRCLHSSHSKELSDFRCTKTNKHFNELWAWNVEESDSCLSSTRLGKHGLTCTWRPCQESSFWNFGTHFSKFLTILKKINKLCDLLLSLLHSSHISKLYLYISGPFYLKTFFIWNFGDNWIWIKSTKDEKSESNTKERSHESKDISKGFPEIVSFMIKIYLQLLKLIFLVVLEHTEEVIDVAIVSKVLWSAILVFKMNLELRHIMLYLMNMNFHQIL